MSLFKEPTPHLVKAFVSSRGRCKEGKEGAEMHPDDHRVFLRSKKT